MNNQTQKVFEVTLAQQGASVTPASISKVIKSCFHNLAPVPSRLRNLPYKSPILSKNNNLTNILLKGCFLYIHIPARRISRRNKIHGLVKNFMLSICYMLERKWNRLCFVRVEFFLKSFQSLFLLDINIMPSDNFIGSK